MAIATTVTNTNNTSHENMNLRPQSNNWDRSPQSRSIWDNTTWSRTSSHHSDVSELAVGAIGRKNSQGGDGSITYNPIRSGSFSGGISLIRSGNDHNRDSSLPNTENFGSKHFSFNDADISRPYLNSSEIYTAPPSSQSSFLSRFSGIGEATRETEIGIRKTSPCSPENQSGLAILSRRTSASSTSPIWNNAPLSSPAKVQSDINDLTKDMYSLSFMPYDRYYDYENNSSVISSIPGTSSNRMSAIGMSNGSVIAGGPGMIGGSETITGTGLIRDPVIVGVHGMASNPGMVSGYGVTSTTGIASTIRMTSGPTISSLGMHMNSLGMMPLNGINTEFYGFHGPRPHSQSNRKYGADDICFNNKEDDTIDKETHSIFIPQQPIIGAKACSTKQIPKNQQTSFSNQPSFTYPNQSVSSSIQAQSSNKRKHDVSRRKRECYRSPLLEDFRNKAKKFELKDLNGHIVEFSGDQHGSRFIQQQLETATSQEKALIFEEIRSSTLQLMTDVFGNYVVQKFFVHGSEAQKSILTRQMEGHVLTLSLQMYGCRVVQKAIGYIDETRQAKLIKELDNHVLQCVRDQNGNHVIQKAIEKIPSEHIKFIIEAFYGQVYQLASHPYGCRVIQRMLEHCDEAQEAIMSELHKHAHYLIQDQYGNYVIQHVLKQGSSADKDRIMNLIKENVLNFSRHKFASNVVEQSVIHGNRSQRRALIDEIASEREDGTQIILVMMKDQFANYVIQKLLDVTEDGDFEMLASLIRPHLATLKKFSYGKHLASIERLVLMANGKE